MTDDPHRPRLISIYGGKLTGYRATAEKAFALATPNLPARMRRGDTGSLPLGQ